MRLKS